MSDYGERSGSRLRLIPHGERECPAGLTAFHAETVANRDAAVAGSGARSVRCHDVLGRVVREATSGFDGTWIYRDTTFDASGRVRHQSQPYYATGGTAYWTTTRKEKGTDLFWLCSRITPLTMHAVRAPPAHRAPAVPASGISPRSNARWSPRHRLGASVVPGAFAAPQVARRRSDAWGG